MSNMNNKSSETENCVEEEATEQMTEQSQAELSETEQSHAVQPQTEQPETEQPEAEQPETEQPEAEQPETEQPEAEQPETEQSEAEQPETKQPKTKQPETEQSEAALPDAAPSNTEPVNEWKTESRSYYFASMITMILLLVLYTVQIFLGKGGNYGMCAIVFVFMAVQRVSLACKLRRKRDIIAAVFYVLAAVPILIFHLLWLLQ